MSIQSEITRLNEAKSTLSNWLDANNIPYETDANLTSLANTISNIQLNNADDYLGLLFPTKTYSLAAWSAIDITPDFTNFCQVKDGIIFEDGKIKIASDATFRYIELDFYMKWYISWISNLDIGNRGVYIYKNGTRIWQEFITCFHKEISWYGDHFSWLIDVQPGDVITIAIVRGGTSSGLETNIDHGVLRARAIRTD